MQAMALTAYKKLELISHPEPTAGPDEVLIRVGACGICGSDVHGYDGSTGRRIPPIIMGHEAAGTIAALGKSVTGFSVGDRVTFDSTVSCGTCHFCRRGQINLCDRRRVVGVSCGDYRQHGAFAEFLAVPAHIVYRLPDSLPLEHAAMIEAVSIAVHAVGLPRLKVGDSAVVIGAGMIGQLIVQTLRVNGVGKLICVDVDDSRLKMAAASGADVTLNAKSVDVVAKVKELTNGRGADVSFEAVGNSASCQSAINVVRKGAQVVLVGNVSPNVELPLQAIVTRELTLLGSCASNGEYPACIELMASRKIDVRGLISAVAPLSEGPAWFERLYKKEPGLMKVILQP
jgi:L-iditol 2-dehydrogenase